MDFNRKAPPALSEGAAEANQGRESVIVLGIRNEAGFRGGLDSGVEIKYTGSREFKNVQIQLTVSPRFGLSGDERNTYQFASWKSGETQFLKSEGMTLSAKGEGGMYSWSGTAVADGTEVQLIGGEGRW